MITILSTIISILTLRFRRRASLELELIGLRHQVSVLRRQHPGRIRLVSTDRLLWVWLYRVWPQVLNALVLVKPATVIQWHRKGFRLNRKLAIMQSVFSLAARRTMAPEKRKCQGIAPVS